MFGSGFNNQNQSAFGSTNTGFGSSAFGNNGFGNNQNNTMGGFGQSSFGNNNNSAFGSSSSAFGNKPFGQSTSVFGSNNNNQSSFGFNNNNNNTFGSSNAFGNKSFLGNNNTSAFGGTSAFGSQNNTGFGFNTNMNMQNNGTGNPPYSIHSEKEPNATTISNFHSITAMPQYRNFSFEELRLKDYQMNKKFAQGFGSSSSSFGNNSFMNSNNSGFGQKTGFGTSTFGQNNTGFGSNNTFGSNNAFGSNNNSGGLFGSNQNNNTFGQMNNNNNTGFGSSLKPSTGFGGFGSNTGFGSNNTNSAFGTTNNNNSTGFTFGTNQNNNTSAFGNNNNAFGMKSATTTGNTGFGFGNNTNNSLTMNKPANSNGLFGSSSFSGFGTNNNTNTSTSLFGNNQNNNTGSSLFGNNNNTNTTGGLFGNKPAIGGGLNMNKPATSTLNTGNKPLFSFNSTGTNTNTFGNQGTSLFGNKPATTSFSFNTNKPATGSLFGNTTTSTLGGINTGLNQPPLQAAIDQAPYGINPLFETVNASSTLGDATTELSESSKTKKSVTSSQYKTTPKATTRIKLQGFSAPSPGLKPELSKKALFDSKNIEDPLLGNKLVTRKSIKKLIINKDDEKNESIKPLSSSLFIQKDNKKINFNENLEISTPNNKQKLNVTPFTVNKVSNSVSKPNIFLTPSVTTSSTSKTIETKTVETKTVETKTVETTVEQQGTKSSYINDYIVSPSLSEMNRMTNDELRHVSNLIVTYPGVGSVHFLEPVDLISASPTHDRNGIVKIFGSVIIIEPKVVTVYPGEENKPPVGQGLNVPAHIELLKCWTMDKTTQKPILDVEHPRFKRHMKKLKTMPDTEFISFDIETGCWSFNVEHFSRYGLFNDDEEEETADTEKHIAKYCKIRQNSHDESRCGVYEVVSVDISSDEEEEEDDVKTTEQANKHEKKNLLKRLVSGELELLAEEVYHTTESSSSEESSDEKEDHKSEKEDNNEAHSEEKDSSSAKKSKGKSVKSHSKSKKDSSSSKRKHHVKHETIKKLAHEQPLKKLKSKSFELNVSPSIVQKENESNINNVIEHAESVSFNHEKNYKNIGLALSRSFRAGWGPGGVLITKLPNIVKNTTDGNIVAMERIVVHRLNLFDEPDDLKVKEQHRITLQNHLKNTKVGSEEEDKEANKDEKEQNKSVLTESHTTAPEGDLPKIELLPKISFESFTDILTDKAIFSQNEVMIWKLCQALFDPILINTSENNEVVEKVLDETKNKYFAKMFKKERINQWLEDYVQDEVENNIIALRKKIKATKDKVQLKELHNEIIFNLLSGRKLTKACQEVIKQGDYRLATVISQCGSCFEGTESTSYGKGVPGSGVMDNYTQNLINQQIALWENEAKDHDFKSNYINLWKLIGGQIDDVCYGLNSWKRTFALFVWFANGGMDDIKDSLEKYEQILESQRKQEIVRKDDLISEPLPSYFEQQLYKEEDKKAGDDEADSIFESYDMKQKPQHYDIIYHLFKYFVDRSYPKHQIFSPQNISGDMLDYRLAWLIYSILTKGQDLSEEDKKIQDQLAVSLAFQLETLGMWDWACYVCLFIHDPPARESAIKNLLYRYYPVDDHSGSIYEELFPSEAKERLKEDVSDSESKKELLTGDHSSDTSETSDASDASNTKKSSNTGLYSFLVDQLKIPKAWINEARIMKAQYHHDVILEAIYLMDAGCWNKVHSLLINEIIPESIINHKTIFAEHLLQKIDSKKVKNWENGGGLFLKYLNIINHKTVDQTASKELLEKFNRTLKSIQKQLNAQGKDSPDYNVLLKRKICLNSMCKEIMKCIVNRDANKENHDLILSFNIPENQRLYNVKKISNEWFDNTIAI